MAESSHFIPPRVHFVNCIFNYGVWKFVFVIMITNRRSSFSFCQAPLFPALGLNLILKSECVGNFWDI